MKERAKKVHPSHNHVKRLRARRVSEFDFYRLHPFRPCHWTIQAATSSPSLQEGKPLNHRAFGFLGLARSAHRDVASMAALRLYDLVQNARAGSSARD